MKVLKHSRHKVLYKWPIKPLRVSSPRKFKKTSYFHWGVEEEEGSLLGKAIRSMSRNL